MKLFIPEIGFKFALEDDWEFDLFLETRNESLTTFYNSYSEMWERGGDDVLVKNGWAKGEGFHNFHRSVTLPKGTELTVDRIYIRKGAKDFSSVSFFINRKSVTGDFKLYQYIRKSSGKCRFWAKLKDVNFINFTLTDKQQILL